MALPRRKGTGRKTFPGITQGVGRTTRKAFGSRPATRKVKPTIQKKKTAKMTLPLRGLNANDPMHLGLPRATGPYTVMRTTQIIDSADPLFMFGTFHTSFTRMDRSDAADLMPTITQSEGWADICCASQPETYGGEVQENTRFWRMEPLGHLAKSISHTGNLGKTCATMTPSALTVQLMNPNALQNTAGVLYGGRFITQFVGEDNATKWSSLANDYVSYMRPRLMSAGKLALRGVTADAQPFNMAALADFDPVLLTMESRHGSEASYIEKWSSTAEYQSLDQLEEENWRYACKGFAPICIYNPDNVKLQFLVTIEWRVRFDYTHPASSTHTHHRATPDATWDSLMSHMSRAGHGISDIVESVANGAASAAKVSAAVAAYI